MKITFENIFLFGGKNEKQIYVWGGVLATLFLAILFCFASCDNGSTSGSFEKNPEILVSYELNGDAIKLYDDNTFVITLKENAGTISGTYSNLTSGHKLMVTKTSGDIAKSGDILRLNIADGKISVVSSDITRYSTGDDGEVTEGTVPTTPSGSQGSADADKDYSLGDAPNGNRLSEDYFNFKDCDDGIYLECTVPAGTWQTRVYIDGIGQVAEEIQYNDKKNRGDFFYPFLDAEKEYTIRVVFLREEDQDDDGFVIDYINGDGVVGWFETKVKAGAQSKGEVRIKDFGEVEVKSNGDFKFTKRLAFENENLLPEDWMINIGLVEGISWEHEGHKTKWSGVVDIPQKELTQTLNLYTSCSWKNENLKIQFICYRPILYYQYDGKEYRYQWNGATVDTSIKTEKELWTNIDISKDIAKIQGTWTRKDEWNSDDYGISCHEVYIDTLVITGSNVKNNWSYTYTKRNGSAFTKEEIAHWCSYYLSDVLPDDCFYYEEGEFYDNSDPSAPNGNIDENVSNGTASASFSAKNISTYGRTVYKYKIYILYSNLTLSSDLRTLTRKYEGSNRPLSEYFGDYESSNRTEHYDFKLFEDETTLKIIHSGNDHGEDYSYWEEYKKQS